MPHILKIPPFWTVMTLFVSRLLATVLPIYAWPLGISRLGAILMVVSLILFIWSVLWFRRKKTTIDPFSVPSQLIIEGPYRLSRNPIYLSMVGLTLGFALRTGALSAVIPVICLAIFLHRWFVLPEEAKLQATFGAEADTYIGKTRRWI